MFTIVEPQWGIDLLISLNAWMMNSPVLIYWVPKLADMFVFVYPVFLVVLYFRGQINIDKVRKIFYKISALFIAFSVLVAVVANLLIQYVFDKVRPNVVLGLIDNKTESILHKFLPSSSFPSDHAAVSMSIAMVTLVRGLMKKDKRFVWLSIPLFVFSLIMSFCRVTGGIHWPTDIIAGSIVGILVPIMVMNKKIYALLEKLFLWIGKKI